MASAYLPRAALRPRGAVGQLRTRAPAPPQTLRTECTRSRAKGVTLAITPMPMISSLQQGERATCTKR